MRALVIDDEPDLLELWERLLLSAGASRVYKALNGEEGILELDRHEPGLVITDLKMPGLDGFAVLDHIHHSMPEQTRVVVCTGYMEDEGEALANYLNITRLIRKPFSVPDELASLTEMIQADGVKRTG